jgi:hypothetical protein
VTFQDARALTLDFGQLRLAASQGDFGLLHGSLSEKKCCLRQFWMFVDEPLGLAQVDERTFLVQ